MAPVASEPVQRVLAALTTADRDPKETRAGRVACCPAHEDARASLSVGQGRDGRVLLRCHAGCTYDAIMDALRLSERDGFADTAATNGRGNGVHPQGYQLPSSGAVRVAQAGAAGVAELPPAPPASPRRIAATYDYVDLSGETAYQAVRYEPKDFKQRRPDGRGGWIWNLQDVERVLYRLPDVLEGIAHERPIFIVEGEKDADTLSEAGYVATTNVGGAGKWSEAYSRVLAGANVVILPDNDDPGRSHAEQVAASLTAAGCVVRVVPLPGLPVKGDVSDWLAAGHDLDALDAEVARAPRWTPPGEVKTRWRLDELWENEELMRPPPPVVPRFAWAARSTLLASAEKAGKSTLCGALATAVSLGVPLLDPEEPCERGTVLIAGLEEFIGDAARRLRHFGADPKRVYLVDNLPPTAAEKPAALRQHIDEVKPTLVIVDTLMAYAEGQISDAASSSQMQPIVQRLTRMAHETGTALVLVHHARKADGKYRDSSAIGGGVDVIAEVFTPDEEGDPTMRELRARGRVPVFPCRFRFDGRWYHLVAGDNAPLTQQILDFVRAHPGSSHAAVRRAITGKNELIDKAINDLLAAERIYDGGRDDRCSFYVKTTSPRPRPTFDGGAGNERA